MHRVATGHAIARIGRRRFIADLGRRGIAVAILGGFAAACSSSDGDDDAPADDDALTAAEPASADDTAPRDTAPGATGQSVIDPPAEAPPDERPSDPLTMTQVSFGFVSAYVLARGNTAAVVDTGTAGSADQIGETLATLGLTFDDVGHVVLTHHHPDHIGSLPEVMARASAATAYAGELDIPNISGADVVAIADGSDVFGLQVIETPGHTPGSVSLFDPGIRLLVAGDALNGNDDGTAISGPNPQFTADLDTANASVVKLASFDATSAAFGHGQPVTEGAAALIAALV